MGMTFTRSDIEQTLQAKKAFKVEEIGRIEGLSPCWLVVSHKPLQNGYVQLGKKNKDYAHRIVLAHKIGSPLPKGMDASHICEAVNNRDSRRCVNPDHIVLETRAENLRRSKTMQSHPAVWYRYGRGAGPAQAAALIV